MRADGPTHFVFVDFENVHTVDLALIASQPVHVTLLIGEKQKRLDLALVRQIHRHAAQVELVEVGATGRNALDLVLACHLGKAVVQHPGGLFHIVSKDKDFNPLVGHLRAEDINVARHDVFTSLPFLTPPKTTAADDRLTKLIDGLQGQQRSRPQRRKTLLSHIQAFYNNRLAPPEAEAVVDDLQQRGILSIDEKGKVSYR
jgi:hypothetical protein